MFALFIVLTSCMSKENENNRKGYEITGHVKNILASRIYMNAIVLDSTGHPHWPVIDSADYVNGIFILNRDTQLIEPAWSTSIFYIDSVTKKKSYLGFNNKYLSTKENPSKYVSITLENANITVDGDVNSKDGLNIRGSKETDFDFKYGLMQPPFQIIDEINKKIDSAEKTLDTSTLASYRNQKNKLLNEYKKNFEKIISQHPSTFLALFNTYQNANYFTPDELQTFAGKFDKQLLETPTGKKFIATIENGRKLLYGSLFLDFTYMDTIGKKTTLQDVKGQKGTLIVFWASWCGPCRQEIPELKKFYNEYNSKGISIVSISVDNDTNAWKSALIKEQMPWINISNLPGNYAAIYSKYNIKAIPLMFLLNSENKILLVNTQSIEKIKEELTREKI